MSRASSAVLFDRDGTLVVDVPYNADPDRVELLPGARSCVERLRQRGVAIGVVTNQSGIGRGIVHRDRVDAVNQRIDDLLGGLDIWLVCPHRPEDRCGCRKPQPGMVVQAARTLGVPQERCTVIGDIGADIRAGLAAGAFTVLVPNDRTRADEVVTAPCVAKTLELAIDLIFGRQL